MRQQDRQSKAATFTNAVLSRRPKLILGLKRRNIQAMAARGEIPGAAKFGSIWTFDIAMLRSYVKDQEEREWPRDVQKRRLAVTGARIPCGGAFARITATTDGVLERDDPKIAAERFKAGKAELIAVRKGDAKLVFHSVVEDWGTHWLQRNKSANTIKRYLCSIDQLAPFLEGKALREIDGELVTDIIRARSKQGVTNSTIKRDLVALSSVMNYAIGQGWLETNPILPRMKLLEERRDPIVLPVKDHIELVIQRSPGMIADLIPVAIAVGAREEELLRARHEHVDHARKQLTVIGKGNKRRVIDLEPFDGDEL